MEEGNDGEDRDFGAEDPEGEDDHETWHDMQKAKISKQLDINKAELDQLDLASRDTGLRVSVPEHMSELCLIMSPASSLKLLIPLSPLSWVRC